MQGSEVQAQDTGSELVDLMFIRIHFPIYLAWKKVKCHSTQSSDSGPRLPSQPKPPSLSEQNDLLNPRQSLSLASSILKEDATKAWIALFLTQLRRYRSPNCASFSSQTAVRKEQSAFTHMTRRPFHVSTTMQMGTVKVEKSAGFRMNG